MTISNFLSGEIVSFGTWGSFYLCIDDQLSHRCCNTLIRFEALQVLGISQIVFTQLCDSRRRLGVK